MSSGGLNYAIVTPVCDEANNLPRLAHCILEQELLPLSWVIVDTGSLDASREIALELERKVPWILTTSLVEPRCIRGGPVARAFSHGYQQLQRRPDIVVKVDADVSFNGTLFQELVRRFVEDPQLGVASGSRYEWTRGEWRRWNSTGHWAEPQCRAYRNKCLNDVMPLEERIGWDRIDLLRAQTCGWKVTTFDGLRFSHHRSVGERERSQIAVWYAQGEAAHYMGYRPSYILLKTVFNAFRSPQALAVIAGYASSSLGRRPQLVDRKARLHLRGEQSFRELPRRVAEAIGKKRHPR